MGDTKTLGLAEMETKVNFFLNETQLRHSNGPSPKRVEKGGKGFCVTRNEDKNLCDR